MGVNWEFARPVGGGGAVLQVGQAAWPIELLDSAASVDHVEAGAIGTNLLVVERDFDLILIHSDAINATPDRRRPRLLGWISRHLKATGRALIWMRGTTSDELTFEEHLKLFNAEFIVSHSEHLEGGDAAFLLRRRQVFAALTIDYGSCISETFDCLSALLTPTEHLLTHFKGRRARLTLFAEMGGYFWLADHRPDIAALVEAQWRRAIAEGHDVQLQLDLGRLAETGSTTDGLDAMIARGRERLEALLRTVEPEYRVTCFRAGAYRPQLFEQLSAALLANDICADSSVIAGTASYGSSYVNAYSDSFPYFADLLDPQLKAVPAEEELIELPVFTPERGQPCRIDGTEAHRFADRVLSYERRARARAPLWRARLAARLRGLTNSAYAALGSRRKWVNRLLPRRLLYRLLFAPELPRNADGCYVAIGDPARGLPPDRLTAAVECLEEELNVEFITLSAMAKIARRSLTAHGSERQAELEAQAADSAPSVMGSERNWEQSYRLQALIPANAVDLLDFGCGAGYWSARIAELHPQIQVVGIDGGAQFIERAEELYACKRVRFLVGDFSRLPMADASFDCVYADNTIEHSFNVQATLGEAHRVLRPGGALVAAFPLDGLNPRANNRSHNWKTTYDQALLRVRRAGFVDIHAEVVDTLRTLGANPFPPALDQMLYLRAVKARPA